MGNNSILIKNIYCMLAYVYSDLFFDRNYKRLETEEFDNIYNLLGNILSLGTSKLVKNGLYKQYVEKNEDLSTLKGKININASIKHKINSKVILSCLYDEYSPNNIFNQIIKKTIRFLLGNAPIENKLKVNLKKLLLFFDDIDDIDIKNINWERLVFHKNNSYYKCIINICYLIIKGLLIVDTDGHVKILSFIDPTKMHTLYEKFILNYYIHHYGKEVDVAAAKIKWNTDEDHIDFLPDMITDITLKNKKTGKTLIIDAKYYQRSMNDNRNGDKKTFVSANLYQIFTYVKNYDFNRSGNVSGMLLYAKTDEDITPDNEFTIDNNKFYVKTLDLNQEFEYIKEDLNKKIELIQ